ncbi:MAG TPA: SigB/SigF/SigG family RNA polymerase sigma factor [Actinocrinis sp.]|uniref:SigB/SigF/SigG family RNA polymerase sigma factor n=1 Tax=Actinocrinis sp. TaxID=1920516 RepID=UPI002D621381|nr:SigB/SigF/SigG family RNA polymerase sigma factor [Actinocrinis sp.]HZU57339.1 SigB/SigF/SigG family RNA polymerase sigma factor [Actinocrinis sp.]
MCTASSQPSCESDESRVASPYAKKRAETMVLFRHLKDLSPEDPERERLRTQLIEDHMRYARHIALRYGGHGELAEDFVQVAYLALVKAVDNFDPERGTGFLGYATPVILGEIKKYFRDATWDVHVPRAMQELTQSVRAAADQFTRERSRSPKVAELAERLGVTSELVAEALVAAGVYSIASLDRPTRSESADATLGDFVGAEDPRLDSVIDRTAVKPLIAALDDRDREILKMRYFQEMTQREIGARLGYSQMHVSRLLAAIFARLRGALS